MSNARWPHAAVAAEPTAGPYRDPLGHALPDDDVAGGPTLETRVIPPPEIPLTERGVTPLPVGMDWLFLGIVIGLMALGTIMAYSASVHLALTVHGDMTVFLRKHLLHVSASLLALVVMLRVPYQALRNWAYAGIVGSLGLLGLVLVYGKVVNKARRWLVIGGFQFQPAELAKIAFAIYLAHSLTKKISRGESESLIKGLGPHFLVWICMFGFLIRQPDLGTGIVLGVMLFSMTYFAGLRVAYFLLAGALGGAGLIGYIIQNPMRLKRLLAFLDPLLYRSTTGFQLFNAKLAVATGGLFGRGLGMSRQKLGFVPEAHTDFILSIIAEELGLVGVALVALGFLTLLVRGVQIASRARDEFGRLLAAGLTILLATQASFNFAVVMGTMPTKGLTLPFVSHGGSSMIFMGAAVGLLLNIGRGGNPHYQSVWIERLRSWWPQRSSGRPANTRTTRGVRTVRAGGRS